MSLILSALALVAAPVQAPADARAASEEARRSDQMLVRKQFIEAGFVPIEEVDEGGREVRRLILHDPYGILPIPGIEFEHRRDGIVTMRLQYREYRTARQPIAKADWDRIVAGDQAMYAPQHYRPPAKSSSAAVPPVCHDWMVLAQASGDRAGSLWDCRDQASPRQANVQSMIAVALATRPDCKTEEDPRWAFQKCFGEKDTLDDPILNAEYAKLVKELNDARDFDLLSAARSAVRAPGLALGSPAWVEARDAVRMVLEAKSASRTTLQKLIALDYRHASASQPDKIRMRNMIRHWSEFIVQQDSNIVEILTTLGWAALPSAAR